MGWPTGVPRSRPTWQEPHECVVYLRCGDDLREAIGRASRHYCVTQNQLVANLLRKQLRGFFGDQKLERTESET